VVTFDVLCCNQVERTLLGQLTDISLNLPVELVVLWQATIKVINRDVPLSVVDNLVQKYAAQSLLW